MSTETSKLAELAETLSGSFKRIQLDAPNKNEYGDDFRVVRTDDAPEWVEDVLKATHFDCNRLPDDWIYQITERAADFLTENDPDRWDDLINEFADGAADVENYYLIRWLAGHLENASFVDEAVEEYGYDKERGIYHAIQMGQYRMAEQIMSAVISKLRELAEASDDE